MRCSCGSTGLRTCSTWIVAGGLVRVQAGITIRELSRRLETYGLALENLGDIDVQSIAGAISTATHGTGARLRNISAQVAELTLVLADGSTLVCSPERDEEVFRAARVGLGALGVIVEVTLRCVPAFTLHGVDAPAPLAADARALRDARARERPLRVLRLPVLRHCADAHEQPHRAAAAPARRSSRRTRTTFC